MGFGDVIQGVASSIGPRGSGPEMIHEQEQEKLARNQRISQLIQGFAALGGDPNKIPADLTKAAGISPSEQSLYGEEAKLAHQSRQNTADTINKLNLPPELKGVLSVAALNPNTDIGKVLEGLMKTSGGIAERQVTAQGQQAAAQTRAQAELQKAKVTGEYGLKGREITAGATIKGANIRAGAEDRATQERRESSEQTNATRMAVAAITKGDKAIATTSKAAATLSKAAAKDFDGIMTKGKRNPSQVMTGMNSLNEMALGSGLPFEELAPSLAFYVPKPVQTGDWENTLTYGALGSTKTGGSHPESEASGWTLGLNNAVAESIPDKKVKQQFLNEMSQAKDFDSQAEIVKHYIQSGQIPTYAASALKAQLSEIAAKQGAMPYQAPSASDETDLSEDEVHDANPDAATGSELDSSY